MTTNTRQIILNTLCNIYSDTQFLLQFDDKESNRKTFQVMTCKIVRESAKGELIVHQCLEPNGYYGWSDRPTLGSCVIPKGSVSLIVYRDNVQLKSTPSLSLYRKGDKIQAMVDDLRKYEHGKVIPQVWRDAIVLNTGIVPKNVSHKNYTDYPYIEVQILRTYWKGDSNGNGEFYDKVNIERFYNAKEIKFSANNIVVV